MDIFDYPKQAGGIARSSQLIQAGFPRRDLLRLRDTGVSQPRRRVFVLPDCEEGLRAAVLNNGRLSCASTAAHYGLWLRKPPSRIHLACNHGRGTGFIRHRTIRFRGHSLLPVAAVEDVALHALGCLPPPASSALATSAIRLHGVSRELLASHLRADRSATSRRILAEL
ncbi:MAG TPA: hypothetical protein VLJ40_09640, partial [Arthrobacter sp.]|nr:hypothetical protein [Arthrobacter sp.]